MTSLRIQAAMASEPIYSYDSKITSEDYDCINNLFKWLSDIPVSMISSWGWGGYWPGGCLNIKTVFPGYGDSHVKDKTVARPSYL